MIVVSHDLAVIRMLTDRTMVLKNGRIVEAGLTDQILQDPQDAYTQLLNNKRIAALDDVSFDMEQGEILGLTGKSGSGKSSLMKCIYRTYLVNSGEIVLTTASRGPVDLAKASEHEVIEMRKTEMFYCSQFLSVIPRVPAVEIVAEPLARKGKTADEAREMARDLLDRLGLPRELWDAFP
eukprot:gene14075-17204_t